MDNKSNDAIVDREEDLCAPEGGAANEAEWGGGASILRRRSRRGQRNEAQAGSSPGDTVPELREGGPQEAADAVGGLPQPAGAAAARGTKSARSHRSAAQGAAPPTPAAQRAAGAAGGGSRVASRPRRPRRVPRLMGDDAHTGAAAAGGVQSPQPPQAAEATTPPRPQQGASKARSGRKPQFLPKLRACLASLDGSSTLTWHGNDERAAHREDSWQLLSFTVYDIDSFCAALGTFWGHKSLSSFKRVACNWGFRYEMTVGGAAATLQLQCAHLFLYVAQRTEARFYHPVFQRDRPELDASITAKPRPSASRKAAHAGSKRPAGGPGPNTSKRSRPRKAGGAVVEGAGVLGPALHEGESTLEPVADGLRTEGAVPVAAVATKAPRRRAARSTPTRTPTRSGRRTATAGAASAAAAPASATGGVAGADVAPNTPASSAAGRAAHGWGLPDSDADLHGVSPQSQLLPPSPEAMMPGRKRVAAFPPGYYSPPPKTRDNSAVQPSPGTVDRICRRGLSVLLSAVQEASPLKPRMAAPEDVPVKDAGGNGGNFRAPGFVVQTGGGASGTGGNAARAGGGKGSGSYRPIPLAWN